MRDTEGERGGEDPHPAYSMESVSFSKIGSRRPDVDPDRLLGSPPTGGHASFAETPAPPACDASLPNVVVRMPSCMAGSTRGHAMPIADSPPALTSDDILNMPCSALVSALWSC